MSTHTMMSSAHLPLSGEPGTNQRLWVSLLTTCRYPASNCGATIDVGQDVNPQDELVALMQHQAALNYTAPYLNSSAFAQQHGKPFMVMEVRSSL
jgi:hypothetical protein